jgi:maltose O-acetyltransferase
MRKILSAILPELHGTLWKMKQRRRWKRLRALGMHIGKGVNLPMSTWIDESHCCLISIGDNCGFGEACAILAHDAMPNEYIDATRIGLVRIHASCHFGMRTIILPGVEIGPRAIVGANSVVVRDIPPDSVASGNPARVVLSMEEYLEKHRQGMKKAPVFQYNEYGRYYDPVKAAEMVEKLSTSSGYIVGGYTAMVQEGACLYRTK